MTHRRNEFSKATMREAYLRSGGICECHRMLHIFHAYRVDTHTPNR